MIVASRATPANGASPNDLATAHDRARGACRVRGRPWYKRFPADFIAGTLGLSLEEKGAYSVVLDMIYDRGEPIPDDARWIARVCGCSTRKWTSLRRRLIDTGKLTAANGCLSNPRAEAMLENAAREAAKLSQNAAKTHQARRENKRQLVDSSGLADDGQQHRARSPAGESRLETPDTRVETAAAESSDEAALAKEVRTEIDEGGNHPPDTERLAAVGRRVLDAIGVADDPRWLGSYGRVQRWLAEGFDPELDILPTVERLMGRRGHDPPRSLAYFDQAIADAKARRLKPMPEATTDDRRNIAKPPSPHDRLLAGFAQAADRLGGASEGPALRRPPAADVEPPESD